jgi:hypothetical protein
MLACVNVRECYWGSCGVYVVLHCIDVVLAWCLCDLALRWSCCGVGVVSEELRCRVINDVALSWYDAVLMRFMVQELCADVELCVCVCTGVHVHQNVREVVGRYVDLLCD